MTTNLQVTSAIEAALIQGDLSRLSPDQRVSYYNTLCTSLGLNPLTQPFAYLKLSGKEVLYAKKDATDQLRKIHGVSIYKLETQVVEGITVVTAFARDKNGKEDSEIGAVSIKGLVGENLANAMMKASTKAKRRVTLSICGLGIIDESEVDSIPDAKPIQADGQVVTGEQKPLQIANAPDSDPGEYVVTIGKKFKDKRLMDLDIYEVANWVNFLKDGGSTHADTLAAIDATERFLIDRQFSRDHSKAGA
jgi:hypothetical protein